VLKDSENIQKRCERNQTHIQRCSADTSQSITQIFAEDALAKHVGFRIDRRLEPLSGQANKAKQRKDLNPEKYGRACRLFMNRA
jgi:hypothetical protein